MDPSKSNIVKKSTYLMGTEIEISIISKKPYVDADNCIRNALNIFHQVVAKYTRFSENSELSALNRSNGKYIEISKELFDLIKLGVKLSDVTDGMFDLTIIDILEAYGYDKDYNFSKLEDPNLKEKIKKLVATRPSYKEIEFDDKNIKIKLAPKQRIDLGSIGKGLAIKLSRDYLLGVDAVNFLINAGGDVYAHGKDQEEKPWEAILFDPEKSLATGKFETFGRIRLKNEAIACSGPWARKVGSFHHLLNPKTGIPGTFGGSTFVKAPDPIIADAFATILFLEKNIPAHFLKDFSVDLIKR